MMWLDLGSLMIPMARIRANAGTMFGGQDWAGLELGL